MKKLFNYLLRCAFVVLSSMLLFGATLNAYIDPSALTYVIQAVAGALIAIGAVVGIVWRRLRRKVKQTMNIDENRNKVVESDNIIISDDISVETENIAEPETKQQEKV